MERQENQQHPDRQFVPAYQEIITRDSGELETEFKDKSNEKNIPQEQESTALQENKPKNPSENNERDTPAIDKKQEKSKGKQTKHHDKSEKNITFREKIIKKGSRLEHF